MKKIHLYILIIIGLLIIFWAYSLSASEIKTKEARIEPLTEQVKKLEIDVAPDVLPDNSYYTEATEQVRDNIITKHEYQQLKDLMKTKIENRHSQKPKIEEAYTWIDIISKTVKDCSINEATENNLIDILNNCL